MKTILFLWIEVLHINNGGIPRVTSLIMNGLKQRGYRCLNLICTHNYTIFYKNNIISEKTIVPNLVDYLKKENIDVIINQDAYSDIFSKWWKNNKIDSIKYITVFHSSPKIYHYTYSFHRLWNEVKFGNYQLKKWAIPRLLTYPIWHKRAIERVMKINRMNYKICDHYVLLSNRFINIFKNISKLSNSNKCVGIGNPLSFDIISNEKILNEKKKILLVVCRLEELSKRVSIILQIWSTICKRYPDWQLRIVGHGPQENVYKAFSKEKNISNVIFTGLKESYEEYLEASIFLMTSAYEGWGLTLTESLQTGVVPIVMNSYESLHDIIYNGINGIIVNNNDISTYRKVLEDLMNNEDKRKQMAINGLTSAYNFTLEKTISKWVQLIEKI